MRLAVEHCLNGIVDAAEVGRLDLHHMTGSAVGKFPDILERVAPFVSDQLDLNAAAVKLRRQARKRNDLRFAVAVAVHRPFDAQMEGLCRLLQLRKIIGHGGIVVVSERRADGAVDVDVQDGLVALVRAHGQDAVTEPFDVLQQLFAVLTELGLHVVDERVRQHLRALDDHLVGVVIAVVAGLRKDGDRRLADRAAVFVRDDLAHQASRRLGDCVQNGLRDTVADSRMQALAVYLDGLHLRAQAAEIICLPAQQHRADILLDDGDKVLCQKQRVASARAGILHRRAVAEGDLAVFQNDHDRDGLALHAHGGKALRDGLTDVKHTVVTRAALDGALVIKIKPRAARSANNILDFHVLFLLFLYLGRPTRRPLLMA